MADLSITAANVKLVSGSAGLALLGEDADAGELVYFDRASNSWLLGGHDLPRSQYGIVLASGVTGQTVSIAGPGCVVDLGDNVLDEGQIWVASSNADGKIAPPGDIDVPAGDTLFLVGYTNTRRLLLLKLEHTGITALGANTGEANLTLDAITILASGDAPSQGTASITLAAITVTSAGTVT